MEHRARKLIRQLQQLGWWWQPLLPGPWETLYRYSAIWRIISAVDFWDKNRLKNTFLAHIFQHKLCTVVFRKILSLIFKYMTNLPATIWKNIVSLHFRYFCENLIAVLHTINFFRKKIIKYI